MSSSSWLAAALLTVGVVYLALASFVWSRREITGSQPLIVMLLAVKVWTMSYALELSTETVDAARGYAALKYVGIVALPPALWYFVLQYTGRGGLSRRALALLMIEPAVVLTLLAIPGTAHDLIQDYSGTLEWVMGAPVPNEGPLFWPHAIYTYVLMLGAVGTLSVQLARIAPPYRRQGMVLIVASVVPFLGNLLWLLEVPPLQELADPTPFLFFFTAVVLVWGFFRLRLLDLIPVARSAVLEQMTDGVLLIDAYGRVVDSNPAAAALLESERSRLIGRQAAEFLPTVPGMLQAYRTGQPAEELEVTIRHVDTPSEPRTVAVSLTSVTDPAGRETAKLLVLHDITERREAERQLRDLLDEQTSLAETLQHGLRPVELPQIDGLSLAARSIPATRGGVGGDFYDVHSAGAGRSAFVLGDVSGKGVKAAVVTSMARYTVRTLSAQGLRPQRVLEELNRALQEGDADAERFCTVVYGQVESQVDVLANDGGLQLTLALGGHPPPLLRRSGGAVEPVGTPGTALGLLPEVDISEVKLDLAPGDVLLAYTDGVTEARNGDEQFGEQRLADVFEAIRGDAMSPLSETVADGVLTAVRAFASYRDDVAVLVLAVPAPGDPATSRDRFDGTYGGGVMTEPSPGPLSPEPGPGTPTPPLPGPPDPMPTPEPPNPTPHPGPDGPPVPGPDLPPLTEPGPSID